MRVLLDKQLAVDLRHDFGEDLEVEMAEYRGWKGIKNGALLEKTEADYDSFVTTTRASLTSRR
jgi:hypothetical protein